MTPPGGRDATPAAPNPLPRIALLAYAVALIARAVVALRTHALYPDGAVELTMAEALRAGRLGEALDTHFHPLTAALTALLSALTGAGVEAAAVVVVVSLSALVAPACALTAARLTPAAPRAAALAGGLLAAVHPALTRPGGQVLAYGVAHALLALAVLALTRAAQEERAWPWAAAGGLAIGAGYLARMDALATGAGLGLGLALVVARRPGARRPAAALALGVAVGAAPFVLALRAHTGAWQLSAKKSVGSVLTLPPASPTDAQAPAAPSLAQLIREEAGAGEPVPGPSAPEAVRFALGKALGAAHPLLVLLLALGLGLAWRAGRPLPAGWALTLLAAASFVGVHVLLKLNWGYTSRLHQSALGVLVVPWAARGLVHATAGRATSTRAPARALALGVALAVLVPKALAARLPHKALQRDVAAVLRAAGPPPPEPRGVCGTGEVRPIAWRAGFTFHELPSGPAPQALQALRRAGVTHLVVYLRRRDRRPQALERTLAGLGVRPVGPPLQAQRGRITYTWIVFRL